MARRSEISSVGGVMLLVASAAAWTRPRTESRDADVPPSRVGFSCVFAIVAVGLATYEGLASDVPVVVVVLTALALLAVVARFALTIRAYVGVIAEREHESLTDQLTGLGNRRALLRDAEAALAEATEAAPVMLAMFDLDGFKIYNDTTVTLPVMTCSHGWPASCKPPCLPGAAPTDWAATSSAS